MIDAASRALLLRKVRMTTFEVAALARARFEREQGPASCASGCAFCCYAKVLVDISEGLAAYMYLVKERRWSPALATKLAAADRALAPVEHDAWLRLQKPCAFLAEDGHGHGRCTIYPVRPTGCAMAFSATKTPATCCGDPAGEDFGTVWLTEADLMAMFHARDLLVAVADTDPHMCATLPGAVLIAHAIVEGLPMPPVFTVRLTAGVGIAEQFDARARAFYETKPGPGGQP